MEAMLVLAAAPTTARSGVRALPIEGRAGSPLHADER